MIVDAYSVVILVTRVFPNLEHGEVDGMCALDGADRGLIEPNQFAQHLPTYDSLAREMREVGEEEQQPLR